MRREALQAAFDFSGMPGAVVLHSAPAELRYRGSSYHASAEVRLRPAPRFDVVVHCEFEAPSDVGISLVFREDREAALLLDGQLLEGFHCRVTTTEVGVSLDWRSSHEPFELGDPESTELSHAISHLFNFPMFVGPQHPAENVPLGFSQLLLDAEGWRITLQELPDRRSHHAWERVKNEGLCLLTHVVEARRLDGSSFAVDDAKEQVLQLNQFLSFVKGSSCWPVFDVGFDIGGNRVWESFCAPRLGEPPYSWCDMSRAGQIEDFYPLFVERFKASEEWEDCFRHAIYFYNQANTGSGQPGVDAAVILAQSGLERLAYQLLVIDRRAISKEGFKKLWSSDVLRLMLSSLEIPMEIPVDLKAIAAAAPSRKWKDGPHAITEIRNHLVHPDSKRPAEGCYFDAWKLSLWYLELSMLAVCGFHGSYRNRLRQGRVEHVPWAVIDR